MPDADPRAWIAERLAAVRRRFLEGFSGRRSELIGLLEIAATGEGDAAAAALDDLRRGLHSLAGSAPTLGLTEIGAWARALEARLADGPRTDGRLDGAAARRLQTDIATFAYDE